MRKVASIMAEIAAAGNEQSSGIEQINKAITQMDTVVQMNASLVEEATAAATSMASQAEELARSVAQFRVEDDGTAAAAATRPRRAARALGSPARPWPLAAPRSEPTPDRGDRGVERVLTEQRQEKNPPCR